MRDNRSDGWQDADAWLRDRAEQDERRYPAALARPSLGPTIARHTPNGSRLRLTSRDYEGGGPHDG